MTKGMKVIFMKPRKTALLLAAVIVAVTVMAAIPQVTAQASYVDDFLNTVGPMCTNDMRDNHILASFSLAQAIWESGWGRSTLAVQANNLFGIRAYSTWGGKVFDRNECVLYSSWSELVATKGSDYVKTYSLSFWRAYDSWQESVNDHSALFNRSSIYENLRGNYDYKSVCKLVVEDGYCSETEYTDCLIRTIENYNLEQYNYDFGTVGGGNPGGGTVTGGANSVTLKPSSLYMDRGAAYNFSVSVTPADAAYTVTSSNSSVASVSGTTVTAVGDGSAKLTLTSGSLSVSCSVTVKSGYGGVVADGVYVDCVATGDTVTIPAEASAISSGAFRGTNVKTVVVGKSVTSIEDGAFDGLGGGFSLYAYDNSTVSGWASTHAIQCVSVSVGWVLESSTSTIFGMSVYTTASLVSMYYGVNGVSATVRGSNGASLKGTDYVGTGCVVTLSGKSYTVSIKGDTDGDGITSTSDLMKLKAYLGGNNSGLPARPYRKAADFNSDERITTADYLAIMKSMS